MSYGRSSKQETNANLFCTGLGCWVLGRNWKLSATFTFMFPFYRASEKLIHLGHFNTFQMDYISHLWKQWQVLTKTQLAINSWLQLFVRYLNWDYHSHTYIYIHTHTQTHKEEKRKSQWDRSEVNISFGCKALAMWMVWFCFWFIPLCISQTSSNHPP